MSKPRPIHHPHRELRTTPDEAEPAFSYEDISDLGDDVADDFHNRLAKSRRESSGSHSGGSFWRTMESGTASSSERGPSFSSVNIRGNKEAAASVRKSPGLLAQALQSHSSSDTDRMDNVNENPMTPQTASGHQEVYHRWDSNGSNNSNSAARDSKKKEKKDAAKQRAAERNRKRGAQSSEVDIGHIVVDNGDDNSAATPSTTILPPNFGELSHGSSLERSSSDQSTGSLLYGKTPSSSTILGTTSSLIFPAGVEATQEVESETNNEKRRKVNLLLDQCETVRFPFKKKLMLNNLGLTAADIPLTYLCGTSLGNTLHKLSLAGNNQLGSVPAKLVQSLPTLKHLELSQCALHQLPDQWNLPQLKRLNLSHNRLRDFPEEGMLQGLPELQELNMYGNKVAEIIIPHNPTLLSKLEVLNLGYNDLAYLPDDLDQLKALKTLKVMNNLLEKVPMRVCDMDLRSIDVSSNPVIQPPIETCERGICSMKRYYHCLRMEEQSKQKALEEVQKKVQKQKKKETKRKAYGNFMKSLKPPKTSPSGSRKTVDGSASSHSAAAQTSLNASHGSLDYESSLIKGVPTEHKRVSSDSLASVPVQDLVKPRPRAESSDDFMDAAMTPVDTILEQVTVNDTLKVIFVGMAMVGKTSMIKRLIEGKDAVVPTHDERTVGVDIYEWDPKKDKRFEHIDSRIEFQDKELAAVCGDVDVKFSVWDFAGQHVYHATHELFFSPRALYVLVWDMGATNRSTLKRKNTLDDESGSFKLSYPSDDEDEDREEDDSIFAAEEEARRADRALERDIDEKVQFWIDCIQSSAPGAAVLPVASFADYFTNEGGEAEAKRRCSLLKQRLLKHEERRINGIKERLKEYDDQNRANDQAANRLRKLLCSYTRPKLIFGDDDESSVVRVSATQYTGFDSLTEKIISIASGREKGRKGYPIFRGHIGARIPRMRSEVRQAVRTMRDRFKVVEWGYFINQLRDRGLTSVEDISDALHFLTNIGELSYFGGVMTSTSQQTGSSFRDGEDVERHPTCGRDVAQNDLEEVVRDDDDDDFDDEAVLSMDDTSITAPSTEDGTLTTVDDFMSSGLSQFVFLNPRWLVAAVACILRHDLDREIKETRRMLASGRTRRLSRASSFYDAQLNCPVITADDACLLWQAKRITKKAAERAQEYSNNMTVTPFEFLQLLLIRFGVFVPIDLSIEKAFLGGKEYAQLVESMSTEKSPSTLSDTPVEVQIDSTSEQETALNAKFFFLPSLLGPGEPAEAWTYKNTESWKTTLAHSVLFPDGVPPGLMERLTASVLSSIYAVSNRKQVYCQDYLGKEVATYEGQLSVKEVLCWRTAFFIKLGTQVLTANGTSKESIVEIFANLADRDSHLCVGSDYMGVGMRRLIISGRGQVGDGGRKIWKGGYLLVCKCVRRVMDAYGGLEYEKHGFCPECLAKKAVSEASSWELTVIRSAVMNSEGTLRCQHGHRVDTRLVAGPVDALQKPRVEPASLTGGSGMDPGVPVQDLLGAVVLVGLWDGRTRKIVRVGSGFVVDRKRGLIVTASHTLMNIWGDKKSRFGENYYGLRQGKVVIGVIPKEKETDAADGKDMAVFRYFAKIVAKDPNMDNEECQIDACVLRITTRMEDDVGGDGGGCGDQPERLLLNNPVALKSEKLQALKTTDKCELEEQVRILGYNQGGEGLLGPGESLNRYVDFARGYVCKKFASGEDTGSKLRDRFKPRHEIVVICPTIGGHSGGPCVNQQGEVIGILSRADPAENQRCYISPTSEWRPLVKQAKRSF